jgi:hypothetical protein
MYVGLSRGKFNEKVISAPLRAERQNKILYMHLGKQPLPPRPGHFFTMESIPEHAGLAIANITSNPTQRFYISQVSDFKYFLPSDEEERERWVGELSSSDTAKYCTYFVEKIF